MFASSATPSSPAAHAPAPASTSAAHTRRTKRSSSVSSSSVVTVKRTAPIGSHSQPLSPVEANVDATQLTRGPLSPTGRRRSSVAHVAIDTLNGLKEGPNNVNRWSQSTSSSKNSTSKDTRQGTFARRLSFSTVPPGAAPNHSPSTVVPTPSSRKGTPTLRDAPPASPHRMPNRPSPAPSRNAPTPPTLNLATLPATSYDPTSASSASATPSTATLFTPSTYSSSAPDYFTPKSNPSGPGGRSPASQRGKPAPSPLGLQQPAEIQSRSRARTGGTAHSNQSSESSIPSSQRAPQSKHSASASHDTARSRARSISDASLRDGNTSTPPRTRERRERDKKTMLSKALQKANTAVLLDNAQNFEGAKDAYNDACRLLQHVMQRSSGEDDRRKLEAIRATYTNRIKELEQLDPSYQSAAGKSLPARPMSDESINTSPRSNASLGSDEDEPAIIQTATVTRIVNDRSIDSELERARKSPSPPPRIRESVISAAIRDPDDGNQAQDRGSAFLFDASPLHSSGLHIDTKESRLAPPMEDNYMVAPLSPRRTAAAQQETPHTTPRRDPAKHARVMSHESVSWLDTLDDSGASSCSSSMHSVNSQEGMRRKHLRSGSGDTEAEFDAALDAAVEAAYDDGLEPEDELADPARQSVIVANALRKVESAKERVREVEREEAIRAAQARERERLLRAEEFGEGIPDSMSQHYRGNAAEEEERMLDEMTKEYMLDGFDFGLHGKSTLPRQSDSSGFSGTTYNSSSSSNRNTAGTSLSTVAEAPLPATRFSQNHPVKPAPLPPSSAPLPPVTEGSTTESSNQESIPSSPPPGGHRLKASNIQNRRSTQGPKQPLKIETTVKPATSQRSPLPLPGTRPDGSQFPPRSSSAAALTAPQATSYLRVASPPPGHSPSDTTASPSLPYLNRVTSDDSVPPASPVTAKLSSKLSGSGLRKNKSSLSLKNRTLSVSSPDGSDGSVSTPMSTTFNAAGNHGRRPTQGPLTAVQTPYGTTFGADNLPTGGMHLFESDIHSATVQDTPNPLAANAPIPLEPCPDSFLLRPFWLMRCFYQTIAHPRGGYLSTKLFIPRDVWSVKGVKLRSIDEKIASCDYLTAALQKLSGVDTLDADAVLEEMQSLEPVLDQVQLSLVKKLGNDVGVNGISTLFKDSPNLGSADMTIGIDLPKSASQSKSYLTSWRKLRSKNSGAGLANNFTVKDVPKDSLVLSTLPMTSLQTIRFAKRDMSQLELSGPNAHYMGALARLFDAVQVIDQIARQVEDPGLKLSSPTHVGLELSTRHAAEFFGFYICRFVLSDVTMLLDKFLKRGSEWVLI